MPFQNKPELNHIQLLIVSALPQCCQGWDSKVILWRFSIVGTFGDLRKNLTVFTDQSEVSKCYASYCLHNKK